MADKRDPMQLFSDLPASLESDEKAITDLEAELGSESNTSPEDKKQTLKDAARTRQTAVQNNPTKQTAFIEEFLKLDSWQVFSQAIPISLGIHPLDTADILIFELEAFNTIKEQAKQDAGKSLKIQNPNNQPSLWQVKPSDFVEWMIAHNLKPLQSLVETFSPLKTLEISDSDKTSSVQEQILSAALYLLANHTKECQVDGVTNAETIADLMIEKEETLLKNETLGSALPMEKNEIKALVELSIKVR